MKALRKCRWKILFFSGLLPVLMSACGSAEIPPDTPLVIEDMYSSCVNGFVADCRLGELRFTVATRHPPENVEIVDPELGTREQFDLVYYDGSMPRMYSCRQSVPIFHQIRQALPQRPIKSAWAMRKGRLGLRFRDGGEYVLEGEGLGRKELANCLLRFLAEKDLLRRGLYPAVKMRHEVRGQWRDLNYFCVGGFKYCVTPADTVRVSFVPLPLEIRHFSDRTELLPVDPESLGVKLRIREGFNEIPSALKAQLHDQVLDPGEELQISFFYSDFFGFNADIWFRVERPEGMAGGPWLDVSSNVNLFNSSGSYSYAPKDSPVYMTHVYRSEALRRALRPEGIPFPPGNDKPAWIWEEYNRRHPHRHWGP